MRLAGGRFLPIVAPLLAVSGCFRITVAPNCPAGMEVGQSVELEANEANPGAIATYAWEVNPSTAGNFDDSEAKDTSFEAEEAGQTVIRLTASDGLFVAVAECAFEIVGAAPADPSVELNIAPAEGEVDDEFTLTCVGAGSPEVAAFVFDQLEGPPVELDQVDGEATFVAVSSGDYTFQCVGMTQAGDATDPDTISITVSRGGRR